MTPLLQRLFLLLSFFVCFTPSVTEIIPVLLNQFALPHAGFSTLLPSLNHNETSWTLIISCFNAIPTTKDHVYSVANIQEQLTTSITPQVITDKILWPNGIAPADVLFPYSFIVPSGFLVPGKTNGNLYFISPSGPIPLVPAEKTHWFYHGAAFKDIDGDGLIDIVSGRANVPLKGNPMTQLIWLQNPGKASITGPWKAFYLMKEAGPDVQVQFAEIDSVQVSLRSFDR